MTQKTLELLRTDQQKAQAEVSSIGAEADGGHARAGFHDNAGLEHHRNTMQAEIQRIGDLSTAVIIEPRENIDKIGLGNQVTLRFIEEGVNETVYFLGPDDVINLKDLGDIVSPLSPLGSAIHGRSIGETVSFCVNDAQVQVKILNIEAGNF